MSTNEKCFSLGPANPFVSTQKQQNTAIFRILLSVLQNVFLFLINSSKLASFLNNFLSPPIEDFVLVCVATFLGSFEY